MSYGLQIFNAAGALVLDTSTIGVVYVETLTLSYGVSSSKTYTDLTGRTLKLFMTGRRNHNISQSVDGSGNPVLTWSAISRVVPRQAATKLQVFAA